MPALPLAIGSRVWALYNHILRICLMYGENAMFAWGPATLLSLKAFWTFRDHHCWLFNQLPAAIIPSDRRSACVYAEQKGFSCLWVSDLFHLSDFLNLQIIMLKSARLLSHPIGTGQTQCCSFCERSTDRLQVPSYELSVCVTRWMDRFLSSVEKDR